RLEAGRRLWWIHSRLIAPVDQFLKALDFLPAQMPELTRPERPQLEEANAHALQLFHEQSEMLEHDADLVLSTLDQPHLVPGVVGVADQPQSRSGCAVAFDRDSTSKSFFLFLCQGAVNLYQVRLGDVISRGRQSVSELPVIC